MRGFLLKKKNDLIKSQFPDNYLSRLEIFLETYYVDYKRFHLDSKNHFKLTRNFTPINLC